MSAVDQSESVEQGSPTLSAGTELQPDRIVEFFCLGTVCLLRPGVQFDEQGPQSAVGFFETACPEILINVHRLGCQTLF